jgi:hypothetical protein
MRIFNINIGRCQIKKSSTCYESEKSFAYGGDNAKLVSLFSSCLLIGGLEGETMILSVDTGTTDTIVATTGVADALRLSELCKNLEVDGSWSAGGKTLRLAFFQDDEETGSVTIRVSEGSPLAALPFSRTARRLMAA